MRAHTNGQTDGRYQVHYLPRFAVDKEAKIELCDILTDVLTRVTLREIVV